MTEEEIIARWRSEHTGVFCDLRARDILRELGEDIPRCKGC